MSIAALMSSMTLESVGNLSDVNGEADLLEDETELMDAYAETENAERDYTMLLESIDIMDEAAVTLESDKFLTKESFDYLAMTMEAAIGEATTTHIMGRSYLSGMEDIMSLESDDASSDERRAEMTLEGITDFLKRAGKAVSSTAKRVLNSINEFYASIFKSVANLKVRLFDVQSKLAGYTVDKETRVRIKSISKRIAVNGSLESSAVVAGTKMMNVAAEGVLKEYLDKVSKFYFELGIAYSGFVKDPETGEFTKIEKTVNEASAVLSKVASDASQPLPGGKSLAYIEPSTSRFTVFGNVHDNRNRRIQKKLTGSVFPVLRLISNKDAVSANFKEGVPMASKKDLEAILVNVAKTLDLIESRKAMLLELKEQRKNALAQADELIKHANKGKILAFISSRWGRRQFRSILSITRADANRVIREFLRYSWTTSRAALTYVSAHVNASPTGGVVQ